MFLLPVRAGYPLQQLQACLVSSSIGQKPGLRCGCSVIEPEQARELIIVDWLFLRDNLQNRLQTGERQSRLEPEHSVASRTEVPEFIAFEVGGKVSKEEEKEGEPSF